MNAPAPSVRSRFAALVRLPEPEIELAAAALLVAAEEYPQLPIGMYMQRLDQLAERVRDRLGEENAPLVVLQEMSRVLADEEGYRGNSEQYYDPKNCYLNDVLDSRVGIPITLAIIWLEVGWRLGLPLVGVNFPGHFLVRFEGEALRVLVDPFYSGKIRFEDEMQELLDQAYGGGVTLDPRFLRAADKKDVIVRLLANLKTIYLQHAHDEMRALSAIERILLLRPDSLEEIRDRGMLLARTGRIADALPDLRRYLEAFPQAEDSARVRLLIDSLEAERRSGSP
jgi:regulator of sirC expression with transglutaminase-like and TPR domain